MSNLQIGALADAEHVTNLYGEIGTLRGVIVSVAEPHSRFNSTDTQTTSVIRPDGSEGTSSSTMPVRVVAATGTPEAREAVRQLLASGKRISERARASLEATL